jgi:ketosteroid isomerase-like protein
MRLVTAVFVPALVASLGGCLPVVAQQMSTDREPVLRTEVKGAFDQYTEWFSAGRPDLVAQRSYRVPVLFLRPAGLEVDSTAEAIRARFEGMFKTLSAGGYSRSEVSNLHVSIFSEHAASVSGRFVRYRKDGSVMADFGATFVFAKTSEGWRIVSMISHDPVKAFELSK